MRKVDPEKFEQKRLEILAAAEGCFVRKGFQGTSISEICAAAGISPGHLYHYFDNKEAIVEAIASLRFETATTGFRQILAGPDPFSTWVRQVSQLMFAKTTGNLLIELLAESSRNPIVAGLIREQNERVINLLSDVIRAGQAEGKLDPSLDPRLAASVLQAAVLDGVKALSIREPNIDQAAVGKMIELLITRFLGKP